MTDDTSYTCEVCGKGFAVPPAALAKFPGWKPRRCLRCRDAKGGAGVAAASAGRAARPASPSLPSSPAAPPSTDEDRRPAPRPTGDALLDAKLAVVLERYAAGPADGVFTDGGCAGNPGPGGWGVVHVRDGEIVAQAFGREAHTTNNRMELMALISGFQLLGPDEVVSIWSDSELCVKTVNEWAARWEQRGWRRKGGEIKNLELVQELYALARARPRATLRWVKAHAGSRWNEYVDTLSTAHLR